MNFKLFIPRCGPLLFVPISAILDFFRISLVRYDAERVIDNREDRLIYLLFMWVDLRTSRGRCLAWNPRVVPSSTSSRNLKNIYTCKHIHVTYLHHIIHIALIFATTASLPHSEYIISSFYQFNIAETTSSQKEIAASARTTWPPQKSS